MRVRLLASAVLLVVPLTIIGLVACGTDEGGAASQDEGVRVEPATIEAPGNGGAVKSEATVLAEHNATPHDDTISEAHVKEVTRADPHAEADAPTDPNAPVMHVFGTEFSYESAVTEVETGVPFTVQFHNDGNLEHDITFEGLEDDLAIHLQPGEDGRATITISEPGEYSYYCTIPGHREAGMTGTLLVSDSAVEIPDLGDDPRAEATVLAEHNTTPHDDLIPEDHAEAVTRAEPHMEANEPFDTDAPVMHVFGSEFAFETEVSEVQAGQPITVQFHNEGNLEHDITFEGLEGDLGIHLQPGEDGKATITIEEAGEYIYYCTVPGHREAGMTGTLLVAAGP